MAAPGPTAAEGVRSVRAIRIVMWCQNRANAHVLKRTPAASVLNVLL